MLFRWRACFLFFDLKRKTKGALSYFKVCCRKCIIKKIRSNKKSKTKLNKYGHVLSTRCKSVLLQLLYNASYAPQIGQEIVQSRF